MKDLGKASYYLGIKVYKDRSKRILSLSQKIYIEEVLKRFGMKNSKSKLLPLRYGIYLSKKMCFNTFEKIQRMSKIPYFSAIGNLMYAMLTTRSDIVLVASVTNRYQSNLEGKHWTGVKNVLKYLRRTKNMFLVFEGEELKRQIRVLKLANCKECPKGPFVLCGKQEGRTSSNRKINK